MSLTDPLPTPRASPISFALGSLTDRVQTLSNEQALSRQAYESLPDRIIALLSPRLTALEATDTAHALRMEKVEARVTGLETWRWKLAGGGVVILAIAGLALGHPIR